MTAENPSIFGSGEKLSDFSEIVLFDPDTAIAPKPLPELTTIQNRFSGLMENRERAIEAQREKDNMVMSLSAVSMRIGEDFPHILENLVARWNNVEEFDGYIQGLLITEIGRERAGFPEKSIHRDLDWLSDFHKTHPDFKDLREEPNCPWTHVNT